jgi:hypothetical protein
MGKSNCVVNIDMGAEPSNPVSPRSMLPGASAGSSTYRLGGSFLSLCLVLPTGSNDLVISSDGPGAANEDCSRSSKTPGAAPAWLAALRRRMGFNGRALRRASFSRVEPILQETSHRAMTRVGGRWFAGVDGKSPSWSKISRWR